MPDRKMESIHHGDPVADQLSLVYGKSIHQQFDEFHSKNPAVYAELVRLARRAKRRGASKVGIGMLFEVVRWRRDILTQSGDGWKLNNNLRAHYARLIMAEEPDLEGIFETRTVRAA